jgi:16S rRNA A1518/A1519 N6-dimethyltransferase RsmA/KsgA/DIM1 with predicted DNA glycosylase/AP lyase activity
LNEEVYYHFLRAPMELAMPGHYRQQPATVMADLPYNITFKIIGIEQ